MVTAACTYDTYANAAAALDCSTDHVRKTMGKIKRRAKSTEAAIDVAMAAVVEDLKNEPEKEEPPPTADDLLMQATERRTLAAAKRDVRTLAGELEAFRKERRGLAALTAAPILPIPRLEKKSGLREAVITALWSDWHVEELMRPSRATQGNAFTLSIADARIKRLVDGVCWFHAFTENTFEITTLVLWLGGDFTTGTLHDENTETAQLLPMAAQLWCYQRLRRSIQTLLDRLPNLTLKIPCSYGNHGRTTRTMHYSTGAHHNLDWLTYQFLAMHFQDEPRVQFMADTSEHQYVDVYGKTTHYHHGHRIRYGGGVGGIMIPINKAVAQWDKAVASDYHVFGHYHQLLHSGPVTVNGSLSGFGPLGLGFKCAPEPAQQAIYIQDSKRGKSITAPIWVSKDETESKLWKRFEKAERDNYEEKA